MAFKLYQNKSVLQQKNSRYVQGGTAEIVGNFVGYWTPIDLPHDDITDQKFTITADFAYRADKIAYKLYGRSDFQWLVLQYNNIVDIVEELGIGAVLIVPSYTRAIYNLTGN